MQLFRQAPRAITEILPRSCVKSVKIMSLSLVSVSRRTIPRVTIYDGAGTPFPPLSGKLYGSGGIFPPLHEYLKIEAAAPDLPPPTGTAYRPMAPRSYKTAPKTVHFPYGRPPFWDSLRKASNFIGGKIRSIWNLKILGFKIAVIAALLGGEFQDTIIQDCDISGAIHRISHPATSLSCSHLLRPSLFLSSFFAHGVPLFQLSLLYL